VHHKHTHILPRSHPSSSQQVTPIALHHFPLPVSPPHALTSKRISTSQYGLPCQHLLHPSTSCFYQSVDQIPDMPIRPHNPCTMLTHQTVTQILFTLAEHICQDLALVTPLTSVPRRPTNLTNKTCPHFHPIHNAIGKAKIPEQTTLTAFGAHPKPRQVTTSVPISCHSQHSLCHGSISLLKNLLYELAPGCFTPTSLRFLGLASIRAHHRAHSGGDFSSFDPPSHRCCCCCRRLVKNPIGKYWDAITQYLLATNKSHI
jgi:hypothetical protein